MRVNSPWPWHQRFTVHWRASPMEAFLRWWVASLRDCLPARLPGRWSQDKTRYYRWPLSTQAPTSPRHARAVLLLPPEQVLMQTLSLPLAAARHLDTALGFELDRFTPFKPDQVYYVARPEGSVSGKLRVTLIVVPRERLAACLAECQERGVRIDGVDVADASGLPMGVELMPAGQRQGRTRSEQRLRAGLLLLCATLLLAIMLLWLHNREVAVARMQAEIQLLKSQTTEVRALRRELDETLATARYLSRLTSARPARAALLSELTECLPADTWLESLLITGAGQVDMAGFSARASSLINRLKGCAHLAEAQYRGALQPDRVTGKDRFYLRALVRQEAVDAPTERP